MFNTVSLIFLGTLATADLYVQDAAWKPQAILFDALIKVPSFETDMKVPWLTPLATIHHYEPLINTY